MTAQTPFAVRAHGAVGDGCALDTAAFQRAIDACASLGGGVVYCSPGRYLIGTIFLQSNIELHLESGCTLLGSTRQSDYDLSRNSQLDTGYPQEKVSGAHLIYARDARNISITGRGTIDGHGRAFFGPLSPATPYPYYSIPGWRPGQLICFYRCQDILIRDIHIVDAPYWTIWPFGCDRVRIHGITIENDRLTPNGDGIDPDCCRDVQISDCTIHAGDDCIAVRSDVHRVGEGNRVCENITVNNCIFTTPCTGVRLGIVGDAPIRNCTFNNIVMTHTSLGIDLIVPHLPDFGVQRGCAIENVSFSNILMDVGSPFKLVIGHGAFAPAGIRNISLSNITATTRRYAYIGGNLDTPVESARFHNIHLRMIGETDDRFVKAVPYPWCYWGGLGTKGLPHAIYCRYARDIEFHNLRVEWGEIKGPWLTAFMAENVDGLELDGFVASQPPVASGLVAARLNQVRDVFVRGCRAMSGTKTFLEIQGATSEAIHAADNDLRAAAHPIRFGKDARIEAAAQPQLSS
jgi:hypothetical protein